MLQCFVPTVTICDFLLLVINCNLGKVRVQHKKIQQPKTGLSFNPGKTGFVQPSGWNSV